MDEAGKRYKALQRRRKRARNRLEADALTMVAPAALEHRADLRQRPESTGPRLATLADIWPGAQP